MSTTTDERITLSTYASGRLRELIADHVELTARIEAALADHLSAGELLDDREAVGIRIVEVLRFDIELTSGQPV